MSLAATRRWVVVALAIVLPEGLTRSGRIAPHVVPPPTSWVTRLVALLSKQESFQHTLRTLGIVAIAVASSVIFGFLGGLAIHALPRLRSMFEPFLAIYYALPFFIVYPVLVAIFGISPMPIILMGFFTGVVAILIATINAMDAIPRIYGKVGRVLRLSPRQVALSLKLPATMPYLFIGFKLAIA